MRSAYVLLLLLLAMVSPLPSSGQAIDLRVPFDRLMDHGFEAYNSGQYDEAATAFRDARLIRPESPEVILNLGLAEAKRGNLQAARDLFRQAQQLLTPEDSRRADALYNEGTTLLQEGMTALEDEETASQAPEKLIEAINKFGDVLQRNPQHEMARHNRLAAQSLLAQMEPPPPSSSQGEGEEDESENNEGDQQSEDSSSESEGGENDPSEDQQQNSDADQQQDGEQQQDSDQQQDGDQRQQQGQPQQQDGEPQSDQQDQQQDQQPADSDMTEGDEEQQAEGQQATSLPEGRPEEMTPEEARQLLNLLGNRELMIFRQSRQRVDPPGGRDW